MQQRAPTPQILQASAAPEEAPQPRTPYRRPARLTDAASVMRRRLTLGYVLALTLLAALTLSGSLVLSVLVLRQSDAAYVINRAGAQRMLSQRIAALAAQSATPGPSQPAALNQLRAAIAAMQASADYLAADPTGPAHRTAELENLYFAAPVQLQATVAQFLDQARALANAAQYPSAVAPAQLQALQARALGPVLAGLQQAVSLHEDAAKLWMYQAIRFHWLVAACTLIALIAIGLFIFRPLAREVFILADGLDREARRDSLTGLLNRRAMTEALHQAMAELGKHPASGSREPAVSVIAIDLDHFKEINDAEGHAAGDALLRATAERLLKCVRGRDLIARIGGDEFAVFLLGVADHATANDVASRIRDSLHLPVTYGSKTLRLGATLGVAIVPRDADSAVEGMRAADEALIRAKLTARGGIGWASRLDTQRVARVAAILRAFDAGGRQAALPGLSAHFQPIISLQSKPGTAPALLSVEALTRWQHPELGDIPPAELMDAIGPDRTAQLGRAVREDALREFAKLRPVLPPGMRVGLNLSANEVARQEMIAQIEDQVRAAGLNLTDVAIEITEQVLLERVSSRIIEQLASLRGRGARLVLDDFGTGNAGLAQLLRLSLDGVKMDRRFIQGLGTDRRADEIVRATLSLAHGLGLDVIAEGVETEAQATLLRRLGCDAAQGYLFAKPMPADSLADWVTTRPLIFAARQRPKAAAP